MKDTLLLAAILCVAMPWFAAAADKDTRCYEMRTYYAAPGKLNDLHARFRDHTMKLFEKHGIVNIGYWVPVENTENKLVYIIAYPSREQQKTFWSAFLTDPEWQAAAKASEANGKLVTKVESIFLSTTDYSSVTKPALNKEPLTFELRTYVAAPGRLEALHARFRDHTTQLFSKHGMTNIGYWTPMKDQKGAEDTLVYIIAHKNQAAADASWKAFQADADWVSAKKASEDKAGGSLTVADGVKKVFLTPTDYSPMK